ncbi:MAG: GNAT family N-acetyltransferase [Promethearchaeota archaeon]
MNGILIIRQPKTKEEFESMYDLRWKILRKPWNQPKDSKKSQSEANTTHFIALINDKIIGTARLHKISEKIGQIKYLAVEKFYRKKGVGYALMESIHITARNQFLKYLILNARETAIKFFEKLGYQVIEDGPLLFGEIKHKKMVIQFRRNQMQQIIDKLRKISKS